VAFELERMETANEADIQQLIDLRQMQYDLISSTPSCHSSPEWIHSFDRGRTMLIRS